MLTSAIQEINADFHHERCCSQYQAVEFVPNSTAKKLSKEHSKELSMELSKEENFTPESGP